MRNIHHVINANDLAKKCIVANPFCPDSSLVNAYRTKIAFEKYLKKSKSKLRFFLEKFLGEDDEYTAEKLFSFIYRENENIYKNKKFEGDYSSKLLDEVFKNFLEGKNEIGDCLGLTQVFSYLLLSKGIEPNILYCNNHVLLEIENKRNLIPLETTRKDGFNYSSVKKRKKLNYEKLESIVYSNIGGCLNDKGYFFNSLKLFDKSLKLYPKNPSALINKGNFYLYENQPNKAIKYYDKSISIDPINSCSYNGKGVAFFKMGDYENALKNYNRAIELNPLFDLAYLNIANIYFITHKFDSALENYKKYASFNENNKENVSRIISYLSKNGSNKNELTR